ncbi:Hypothetical protein CINCED_3A021108 [Cinara cedri]|uniref:Uncharacterized protein n=1 Tax=Cinara cedri TaxID=506608 RepID=A0A5E4N672_9HEMI|nr:Hypothetical protein CINCED_3A021108 [Cinara cedri]
MQLGTVISSSSSSLPSTVSVSDTPITQFTPSTTDIMSLTKQYSEDLEDIGNCDEVFNNEFKLWQRKLKYLSETDKPKKRNGRYLHM